MTTLLINGNEYKIKFGYNCFCDSDLLEKVKMLTKEAEEESDGLDKLKEMFVVTRELLFVGFERYNPVSDIKEIGFLLDDYLEEAQDGEKRGIFHLFNLLSKELMEQGFLADMVEEMATQDNVMKIPQDHKKSTKKQ